MSGAETHELSFEAFNARVSVDASGEVRVSFYESGRCVFTIGSSDFAAVIAFVEKHAEIQVVERGDG